MCPLASGVPIPYRVICATPRGSQVAILAAASVYEPERLKAMAEAERQRQVEAGITDDMEDMMPFAAPTFVSLLGR